MSRSRRDKDFFFVLNRHGTRINACLQGNERAVLLYTRVLRSMVMVFAGARVRVKTFFVFRKFCLGFFIDIAAANNLVAAAQVARYNFFGCLNLLQRLSK